MDKAGQSEPRRARSSTNRFLSFINDYGFAVLSHRNRGCKTIRSGADHHGVINIRLSHLNLTLLLASLKSFARPGLRAVAQIREHKTAQTSDPGVNLYSNYQGRRSLAIVCLDAERYLDLCYVAIREFFSLDDRQEDRK